VWDIADVSAYLQIPVSSIYKMTARKASVRIPHIRIGRALRFRQSDVDQWLTLLTTSNIEALSKMRQKVSQVTHGRDPQAQAP
jgi:excisionase family DNA binding protein